MTTGIGWGGSPQPAATVIYPLKTEDIRVRDPFVYVDPVTRRYHLYAQTGNREAVTPEARGVEMYTSTDLERWTRPVRVLRPPDGFWGGDQIWAPEVHRFGEWLYLFVTFNGREGGRGTQIFRAPKPEGPFEWFSADASTPPEQCCLDGTPWVDRDGRHWLVYCHEWVQIGDGAIRAVEMSSDWARRLGEPIELFRASSAPWVRPIESPLRPGTGNFVTDGPFLQSTRGGRLLMLWSSFGRDGYALSVAESARGDLRGPWTHQAEPWFGADGGHGMLFRTLAGQLRLVLHQPNSGGKERARSFTVVEANDRLVLQPPPTTAGYLFAHMTHQDYGRLYYSVSTNGLQWRTLNGGRRVHPDYWGHPDLCRGHDGRYYLLGNRERNTDLVFWVSTNLVNWTRHREWSPDVANAVDFRSSVSYHGAPKIYFDEATREYLVTWHTPTLPGTPLDPEAHWRSMRTLGATSPDLAEFSRPRRLFGFDWATIDVIVRREGDRYFAVLKDELWPAAEWPSGKSIRIASADTLLGPYGEPGPRLTPNFREAPTVIPRRDGGGWYLYAEQYPGLSYGLSTAPRLEGPWHDLHAMDYATPNHARHGSMIPISAAELKALLDAYPD